MIRVYYVSETLPDRDRAAVMLGGDPAIVRRLFAAGSYRPVCELDTDDLEEAWKILQNGIVTPSWVLEPPAGVRPLVEPYVANGRRYGWRSSCVGDVYEIDGVPHVVASIGFEPL